MHAARMQHAGPLLPCSRAGGPVRLEPQAAAARFPALHVERCTATGHDPAPSQRLTAYDGSTGSPQLAVGVHVAAVPLVGFEEAERRLGRLYPDQLALHTLVILEDANGGCTAFDFLPLNPTSPLTASRLMTGQSVPGEVRVRSLRRGVPRRRCWRVADVPQQAVQRATAFQAQWPTDLRLFRNDCRNHSNALVEHLTGVRDVLGQLPMTRPPFR